MEKFPSKKRSESRKPDRVDKCLNEREAGGTRRNRRDARGTSGPVEKFRYLGSTIQRNGEWKSAGTGGMEWVGEEWTGVICDKVSARKKGKKCTRQ